MPEHTEKPPKNGTNKLGKMQVGKDPKFCLFGFWPVEPLASLISLAH